MAEEVDALTFPMSRESESASRVRAIVSDMLPRFSNHHIEDVLPEYITLLICNGKSQSQARKNLEAFLGEHSSEFVACVWELLLKYFSQVKQGNSASEPNNAVEFCSHDTQSEQGLSNKEHDVFDQKATNATNSMNQNLEAVTVPIEDIEAPVSPKYGKLKMLPQVLIDSPCKRVQGKEKEDWNLPGGLGYCRKTLRSAIVSAIKQPCGMIRGGAVSAKSHDEASVQERTPRISVWDRLGKVRPTFPNSGIEAHEVRQQHGPAFPAAYREHHSEAIQREVSAVTSARPHTSYNLIKKRRYDINNSSSEDFSSVLQYKQAKEDVEKPSLLSYQYTKPDIFSEIKNVKEKLQQLELQLTQSKQLKKQKLEELQYQQDVAESRIIHVTNVHYAAKKEAISMLFSKCGAVSNVKIVTDPVTRQRKGTAFVTFASKESVNKAIALSGTMFYSRPIKVWRHVIASGVMPVPQIVTRS